MSHQPPEHLDEQARVKWAEVLVILEGRGDVDQAAADALAAYCTAWSRWIAAEAEVQKLGQVIRSPSGFATLNPFLSVSKDSQRQLRQWADVLQLHKKVKVQVDQPAAGGGGFLRLLGGKGKTA